MRPNAPHTPHAIDARRGGGGRPAAPFTPDSLAGYALDIDASDYSAGALAALTCKATGLTFTGAATRAANINGQPSIDFNGTTHRFQSDAPWAAVNGATALTWIGVLVDTDVDSASVILEQTTTATTATGALLLYTRLLTVAQFNQMGRGTALSEYYATDSLATAGVWSGQVDFGLTTAEAALMRKDGATVSTTLVANNNNVGQVFGNHTLYLGARGATGTTSLHWAGKIGRLICYARALTIAEINQVERYLGGLWGISVPLAPSPASAGLAFGTMHQSNDIGQDTDVSAYPSPWPPIDTADRLKRSANGASLTAASEPFNGVGGSRITPFLDALARVIPEAEQPYLVGVPAPSVSGTSVSLWAPDSTNYNNLRFKLYTAKRNGYTLGGVLVWGGETDAETQPNADAFLDRYRAIRTRLRSDLGEPSLRFVFQKINHAMSAVQFPYLATVNAAIDTLAAEDANTIAVALADTTTTDGVHSPTEAQITAGEDEAATYIAAWL